MFILYILEADLNILEIVNEPLVFLKQLSEEQLMQVFRLVKIVNNRQHLCQQLRSEIL